MFRVLPFLWLLCAPLAALATPVVTHPFSVQDLLAMDRLSAPQVSPDGQLVVFVLSCTDLEGNRRRTDLWLVGAGGSGLRPLTSHEAGDSDPRWAADGLSIWFLSSRSGTSQVWRIPVGGGEAEQVTRLSLDVNAFRVTPDDAQLVVAMEVFPGDGLEETRKRLDALAETEKSGPSGKL